MTANPADRTAIHAVVAHMTFIRSFSVYDGEAAERNNAFAGGFLHSVIKRSGHSAGPLRLRFDDDTEFLVAVNKAGGSNYRKLIDP